MATEIIKETEAKPVHKNYLVLIKVYATVLVLKAESEDKALEYATDDAFLGDCQLDEAKIEKEVPEEQIENAKKHADSISTVN